jgi:hypothetical protein
VGPNASLRLRNLIITAEGIPYDYSGAGGIAALIVNEGRLALENCIIEKGGHGIHHLSGNLDMARVYVRQNAQDGLRMEGGYATLINCELISNGGNGLGVLGGDARLTHCGVLGNGGADVLSLSTETLRSDNCLFGKVAPLSVVAVMRHCLAEKMPNSVAVDQSEGCLLNVPSWCSVTAGEIGALVAWSPCVNAGLNAGVRTDIQGTLRVNEPDIGPLEYTGPPLIPSIPAFSAWGLILFLLLMATTGLCIVRRAAGTAEGRQLP